MMFTINTSTSRNPPCGGTSGTTTDRWGGRRWLIDIETLDDLIKFAAEQDLIISVGCHGTDYPNIEIYDDYRE